MNVSHHPSAPSKSNWFFSFAFFLILSLAFLLIGCATQEERERKRVENTPQYRPTNVYSQEVLPNDIKRVVVLPPYSNQVSDPKLDTFMQKEVNALVDTNKFETLPIDRRTVANLYGHDTFRASDQLPNDFLDMMVSKYAADAVLFTEITRYDPYQPLKLGVRMNLVSIKDGASIWAMDDGFNSGDPRVASGAMAYQNRSDRRQYPSGKIDERVLKSPLLFAEYVFFTAFSSLPDRSTTLDNTQITRQRARNPNEKPIPSDQEKSDRPEIPKLN